MRVDGNAVGALRRRCTGLSGDNKLDRIRAGAASTARIELEAGIAGWGKGKNQFDRKEGR
jgi:hypothetical protein